MRPDTIRAYQRLFASEDGQQVLGDLIARFGYTDNPTFDSDAHRMAYNEGQRAVMIHVGKMMRVDADQLEEDEEGEDDGTNAQL